MTPTVPELLLGNFLALIEPPPPEAMGEFLQGRVAVTGMISMLCAQEAERGTETRLWENADIRALLRCGAARHGAAFAERAEVEDKDMTLAGMDRVNAALRKALIDLHIAAEEAGDRELDHAILRHYVESADRRRLDLPPMPGN